MFQREFMTFAGDDLQLKNCWQSHITSDTYPWALQCWFLYKPKAKTTGKVQKTIDELASKTLDLPEDVTDMIKNKNRTVFFILQLK